MKITKEINNKKAAKNGLNPTSQKGITLIALIITIIIMLILVGVTISMAINGGLFDYAGKAVGDMKNSIAYEKELSNGRIKIGGVWYDSINDFVQGIVSGDQTEDEIIITASVSEDAGGKYIDLSFQLAGLVPFDEYMSVYSQEHLADFVDYNIMPEETTDDFELIVKDILGNDNGVYGDDNVVIDDAIRNNVIKEASNFFKTMAGMEIVLPYEQSLRVYMYYALNSSNSSALNLLYQTSYLDMAYCYVCEIVGIEPCYEEGAIEDQILELVKYNGEFEDYLEDIGESKTELQEEASTMGIQYGMLLKLGMFENEQFMHLVGVDVTLSDGREFEAILVEGLSIPITEDGTYKITAEMQDGSGRKGEKTISTSWVMAWTYADGSWSNRIEAGGTAQGDIVVKVYETGNTITPDVSYVKEEIWPSSSPQITPPVEGPAYSMVVEGAGNILLEDDNFAPWSLVSLEDWVLTAMLDRNMVPVIM